MIVRHVLEEDEDSHQMLTWYRAVPSFDRTHKNINAAQCKLVPHATTELAVIGIAINVNISHLFLVANTLAFSRQSQPSGNMSFALKCSPLQGDRPQRS